MSVDDKRNVTAEEAVELGYLLSQMLNDARVPEDLKKEIEGYGREYIDMYLDSVFQLQRSF